jgi:hypothetical protein
MVMDMLTKALPSAKVKHFTAGLRLRTKWGGVSKWAWQESMECPSEHWRESCLRAGSLLDLVQYQTGQLHI